MYWLIVNIVLIIWTITFICFCLYISSMFLEWCYMIFIRLYRQINGLLFIMSFKLEKLSYEERKKMDELYNILIKKNKEND